MRRGGAAAVKAFEIALVQMRCDFLDVAGNLKRAEARIRAAARHGAKLVCLPEAFLTGYRADRMDAAMAMAEPADGPSATLLAGLAKRHGIWLLAPFLERTAAGVMNSALLIDGEGRAVGRYSKTHLIPGERERLVPGDRLAVWETPLGTIGCLICYDICFPETARRLAEAGAKLLLVPAAWRESDYFTRWWRLNIACRALDNQVCVAAVNQVGPCGEARFAGRSMVCDAEGAVLARCGGKSEATLYASVSPEGIEKVRAAGCLLDDMRPALYAGQVSGVRTAHDAGRNTDKENQA